MKLTFIIKKISGLLSGTLLLWFAGLIPAQAAETIPLPDSAQLYIYCPVAEPVAGNDPSALSPVGVGTVAGGGNTLSVLADTGEFADAVDIYFGIYAPAVSEEIFLVKSDETFQTLSSGLVPFAKGIFQLKKQFFGGSISTSLLPSGDYDIYLLAAAAGTTNFDKYYLWNASFIVQPSYFSVNSPCSDFGSVVIGDTSSPQTITISNPGDANGGSLKINSITPLNDTVFFISNYNCTDVPLSSGQSCSFDVSFKPDAEGKKNLDIKVSMEQVGAANVLADAGSKNFKIRLMGKGLTQQCAYSISPSSNSLSSGSATDSVSVTAQSGCSWTATSGASWITITSGGSGSGSGTVNYSVSANTATSSRTGVMTIAGNTFTVTQSGSCTYSISPSSNSFSSGSATGSVSVTAQSGCSWTATSGASWITITSGGSGSGSGTVNYSVSANTATSSRTGEMTIAGNTFTVTQSGSSTTGCTYSISPTSYTFSSSGGSTSITVTATSGCSWTAKADTSLFNPNPWVTVTSGSSGSGNGTVTISAPAYTSSGQRTSTLTVAGKKFTAYQNGSGCTYTISPTSQSYGAAGGTGTISITTGSSCAWSLTKDTDWITFTSTSNGTGSGTVSYSVSAYATGLRKGSIYISEDNAQSLLITQDSTDTGCSYTIAPPSASFDSSGGTGSFTVAPSGNDCIWTASTTSTWITISSGGSGTGAGTVNYTVTSNSGAYRSGTITIGKSSHTVTQQGSTSGSGITYSDLVLNEGAFASNPGRDPNSNTPPYYGRSAKYYRFTVPSTGCPNLNNLVQSWLAGTGGSGVANNNMLITDTDFSTESNAMQIYHDLYNDGANANKATGSSGVGYQGSTALYWYYFTTSGESENIDIATTANHTYYIAVVGEDTTSGSWRLTVYCQ